jgi:hypothetical protein
MVWRAAWRPLFVQVHYSTTYLLRRATAAAILDAPAFPLCRRTLTLKPRTSDEVASNKEHQINGCDHDQRRDSEEQEHFDHRCGLS